MMESREPNVPVPLCSSETKGTRRLWEPPLLTKLPRLSELTLQSGGGQIPGGGGTGGGGSTVVP